jgi:catechol 2,3-dioxygenase-like lactoylglutathione lyase family enzyme
MLILKHRAIALGFELLTLWHRLKRRLRTLARPRLRHLDHVTLPVRDLGRARAFYCDLLGAEHVMTIDEQALQRFGRPPAPDGGNGAYHVSLLMGGVTRVDLFQQRSGQPPQLQGHPHHAFRVSPGAMLRWKRLLEDAGVRTEGPLQLGFPGQASLYFDDPDGNHLELVCYGFGQIIPVRPPDLSRLALSAP